MYYVMTSNFNLAFHILRLSSEASPEGVLEQRLATSSLAMNPNLVEVILIAMVLGRRLYESDGVWRCICYHLTDPIGPPMGPQGYRIHFELGFLALSFAILVSSDCSSAPSGDASNDNHNV